MVQELKLTKNLVENLTTDIRDCFLKGKNIKTYNDICKLIEKLDGKIELIECGCDTPYFMKNDENTFTMFILKSDYEKIYDPYYESRLIYNICQSLSVLFLVAGYSITTEYWQDIPNNVKLDGITEDIEGRIISPEMSHYFACNLFIGKKRFINEMESQTSGEYVNLSKVAENLNISKTIAHNFGYLLGLFPAI